MGVRWGTHGEAQYKSECEKGGANRNLNVREMARVWMWVEGVAKIKKGGVLYYETMNLQNFH